MVRLKHIIINSMINAWILYEMFLLKVENSELVLDA